jgi:hypothetical protein
MKIRTKISLIILFVEVLLAVFIIVVNLIFDLFHYQKYLNIAYRITSNFVEWNNKFSSKSLKPFVAYYVELQTKKLFDAVEQAYISS